MKTTKTYSQVIHFANVGSLYLEKNTGSENKLCGAIKSSFKQVSKLIDSYNDLVEDARIECCYTDEKGIIVRNEKGELQFTPEGQLKLKRKVKVLLEIPVEVHQRIYDVSEETLSTLSEEEREAFSGIVIVEQNL